MSRKLNRSVKGAKKVALPNELIFRHYIEARKPKALNPQWVFWMLAMLYDVNEKKKQFNTEFLKDHPHAQTEPEMEASET